MSLRTWAEHLQATGRLPSIVLGVVRDGAVVDSAEVNASLDVAYRIGSITKTFTAVLVMALRDEGRLALDDPLGRFVPEAGYADAMIGDVLGHTAGLQSEPVGPWWERSPGGPFAALAAANDGSGAVAGAGEWFHYSNLGYGLLGEVVARLHGRTWWDVVATRLLDPLGLERTSYGPEAPHAQGHSVEHFTGRLVDEPHTDTGAMAAAGQLWSTIGDLATWSEVLAGARPEVIAASSAHEMALDRLGSGYGLGLRRVDVAGTTYVGHTGSMPGFLASLFVDPGTGRGIVALADATTGLDPEALPAMLLDDGDAPVAASPWRPTERVPELVAAVVGVWFWGHTAIELRWNDGALEARTLQSGRLLYTFALVGGRGGAGPDRLVGRSGYHRGETLHVHATHLECATFVYTREPYDPRAPIPGPAPAPAPAPGESSARSERTCRRGFDTLR